ncbi:glucitol operon activator protein [Pasteurella testudinis DSM 23072]|uniref:Glucitol operon activator protein n=1 Tax=Pasteurella testudinis DSM 23072 TaxID=1122938 RepID=A0A1W1URE7_9PAST|nr:transcriptional regulator GutM [Pasteurella testudinis]SMB83613.1 glucitol operon activator protein [Pasteurella testudinis DSM 23072]SUB51028.1 glucitol operon activator protein [Pasteurella testudinis]
MDTINILILVAVLAWLLQIALGWRQVSRFNTAFELLCQQGNVGVGRTQGRFKPKVVIAVAFDSNKYVTDSLLMKGYTVFSRPQSIGGLKGLKLGEIVPRLIFPDNQACQEALAEAIRLQ